LWGGGERGYDVVCYTSALHHAGRSPPNAYVVNWRSRRARLAREEAVFHSAMTAAAEAPPPVERCAAVGVVNDQIASLRVTRDALRRFLHTRKAPGDGRPQEDVCVRFLDNLDARLSTFAGRAATLSESGPHLQRPTTPTA